MDPLESPADEPTDPGWKAVSKILDRHEALPELRAQMLDSHRFSMAAFCTTSIQAFSALHKGSYAPADVERGIDFHGFAAKLDASERKALGALVARAPMSRKASKAGQTLSELHARGGALGAEVCACALDEMALAFSTAGCPGFPVEPRARLLDLAARRARSAWPPLLATALGRACHAMDLELLRELLDALGPAARCFGAGALGWTPLGLAIERGCGNMRRDARPFACAELLLARGADPDARDAHGLTPLAHAARARSLQGCALLLAAGADPWASARDPRAETPPWVDDIPLESSCADLMALAPETKAMALSLLEARELASQPRAPRRGAAARI